MDAHKRNARIAGILYIVGTASGALSFPFIGPIQAARDSLAHIAADLDQAIMGALAALVMGLALA